MKIICIYFVLLAFTVNAVEPEFRTEEIDSKVGVGYGLQLADMNGDLKNDTILLIGIKVYGMRILAGKSTRLLGI